MLGLYCLSASLVLAMCFTVLPVSTESNRTAKGVCYVCDCCYDAQTPDLGVTTKKRLTSLSLKTPELTVTNTPALTHFSI